MTTLHTGTNNGATTTGGPLMPPTALLAPKHHHYYFNENYLELVVLRDGSSCQIRLMRPSDHDLEVDLLSRLSSESRYMRFGASRNRFSEEEIRYFTIVDQESHFALVAYQTNSLRVDSTPRAFGVARFIRSSDPTGTTAEPAVAITDDAQGKGLGYVLSCRLAAAARERGIERFEALVLPSNIKVLRLFEKMCPDSTEVNKVGSEIILTAKLPKHIPPPDTVSWKQWCAEENARPSSDDEDGDSSVLSDQIFDDMTWH